MSSIPEIAIKRPVMAWMIMAGLILFGLISFHRLGVSQLPDVDFPVLSIAVTWEGAAPEVMEAEIVDRLEQALISVEGLRDINSSIRQGRATVTLEFNLERDVDAALQEVQSAISNVRLPLDVDPPTIRKTNPDDQPIIWVGLSSSRPLRDLIEYIDRNVRDQFQLIPGVGEIILGGFTDRSLRLWIDNEKLKVNQLSILDIQRALAIGHYESAAGIIENDSQEINLRVMGEGLTPEQVGAIKITQRGGRPIYNSSLTIGDVARVEDDLADVRRITRMNGVPGVGLGIKKQRGANSVEVGNAVKELVARFSNTLPKDIQIGINFDSTRFIEESIDETEFTLVLSGVLTAIVCWLFLGSIKPTINVLLSIPFSIIGAFSVIYFFGFTLNTFTLLGLALAIGIVVDDTIMMLENIVRHKQMGKSAIRASIDGATEISFAAIAATVAIIAIFVPVIFMQGVIGKFFFQFGVTITAAVALSLVEALTLTPVRCSQFLSDQPAKGWFEHLIEKQFDHLASAYRWVLRWTLKLRWVVVGLSLLFFVWSLSFIKSLRKEFIPAQDQSVFLMRIETPVGSSIASTSAKIEEVEKYLLAQPEVTRVMAAVGGFGGGEVNTGITFVTLKPPGERALTQTEFMNRARNDLKQVRDAKIVAQDLSTRGFTAQRGFPVEFNIRGGEWSVLQESALQIIAELEKLGLVTDADTDYRVGQPEVRIWPNREKAASRGVNVNDLAQTITAALGGVREGRFTREGRRYDVRLRLQYDERNKPEDLLTLQVRNVHGELVPISEVIEYEKVPTQQVITRRGRERSISVFANVAPGKSQAEAISKAEEIARRLLPDGYRFFLGGGAQTFSDSFSSLMMVLWLGLAVAYMVLASQFNSYIHPFTVLLALPFSLSGAFIGLDLADQSLNLYSFIGIILLMGIVKKNSIMLVEFANHKRDQDGMSSREALLEACPIRLRPILMTSIATLAAAIPPALALGPGAESRIPMAVSVLGGVLVSTVLTLFVVPAAYLILSRIERRPRPISKD